eukprot:CAMPEP_0114644860 /NCGR_PEP_ID=MMETSP0191-20121206/4210_1 /TAXON_ID=126664 /ORGANISM="Sorites sp." /LENGTH=87 /DNA_ID=CAMNT_0001857385 /DNA_START=100 /DNA_END=360 /DNA_ORIENTATION=-
MTTVIGLGDCNMQDATGSNTETEMGMFFYIIVFLSLVGVWTTLRSVWSCLKKTMTGVTGAKVKCQEQPPPIKKGAHSQHVTAPLEIW